MFAPLPDSFIPAALDENRYMNQWAEALHQRAQQEYLMKQLIWKLITSLQTAKVTSAMPGVGPLTPQQVANISDYLRDLQQFYDNVDFMTGSSSQSFPFALYGRQNAQNNNTKAQHNRAANIPPTNTTNNTQQTNSPPPPSAPVVQSPTSSTSYSPSTTTQTNNNINPLDVKIAPPPQQQSQPSQPAQPNNQQAQLTPPPATNQQVSSKNQTKRKKIKKR